MSRQELLDALLLGLLLLGLVLVFPWFTSATRRSRTGETLPTFGARTAMVGGVILAITLGTVIVWFLASPR